MTALHQEQWRKSSYSANTADCVEVALRPDTAYVRDTKARQAGHLEMTAHAWQSLLDRL